MSAWTDSVLRRLAWMTAVDRNRNEFGAASHRYALAAPLSEATLEAIEHDNGYPFPAVLRDFWLHAGARGAGPNYGVLGPNEVQPFRPAEPRTSVLELQRRGRVRMALWNMPGQATLEADHERDTGETRFESLVAYAAARGLVLPEPEMQDPANYFEGSWADITGLIGVIEEGCGHMTAVATQPPGVGQVLGLGADGGVWETDRSFDELYDQWLDGLIATYSTLVEDTAGGVRMHTIRSADTLVQWKAVDRLASMRGITRPTFHSVNEIHAWTAEMLGYYETLSPLRLTPLSQA